MDDALCLRALGAICVHMAHHIMAHFFLTGLCHIIVDFICMGLQLINLLLGNIKA